MIKIWKIGMKLQRKSIVCNLCSNAVFWLVTRTPCGSALHYTVFSNNYKQHSSCNFERDSSMDYLLTRSSQKLPLLLRTSLARKTYQKLVANPGSTYASRLKKPLLKRYSRAFRDPDNLRFVSEISSTAIAGISGAAAFICACLKQYFGSIDIIVWYKSCNKSSSFSCNLKTQHNKKRVYCLSGQHEHLIRFGFYFVFV